MKKNTNKCKHMQTNKRWGATAVRHGGEDTWQEMATDKNRHGMYCTRREGERRENGDRETKNWCSCQGALFSEIIYAFFQALCPLLLALSSITL